MTLAYAVKLHQFEGPLDLLLNLIKEASIDLYNIPIHRITRQFLDHLAAADQTDLEELSDFLVLAATLLEIKSQMLLPDEDLDVIEAFDGTDPREQLVEKLVRYKIYQEASRYLEEREATYNRVFSKPMSTITFEETEEEPLEGLDARLLERAIGRLMLRATRFNEDKRDFFDKLRRDPYTVEEKIDTIRHRLRATTAIPFLTCIGNPSDRFELINTFLALLELMKMGEIRISQTDLYAPITIERRRSDTHESTA